MTAQEILEGTLPLIAGSKISRENNFDTLLTYLNLAKGRLARDTNLWIGGETIELTDNVNEYVLSEIPLQIIEIFDSNLTIRPRNKMDIMGYTQISPNTIYVNSPSTGVSIDINYFKEPVDYILTDTVFISNDLIEALQHYIASKVFSVYKSQDENIEAKIHYDTYKRIVDEYIAKTDMPDIDTFGDVDLISQKGLV